MVLPRHVYVHVPFCARRCAYCDFSIAVRRVVPTDEYATALAGELAVRFGEAGTWTADTLYFGGGTPSRLGSDLARVVDNMRARITFADDAEVTIEANPDDVTDEAIAAWKGAGVNRLSIGAQSFNDGVLAWMHRTHDATAIGHAVDAARRGGIENISLDLIFALPEGIDRSWTGDVARALELEPSHLSLYGLTIESHTPLGRWQVRGEVIESPDERYETEFLHAHDAMTAAGFEHYEVSNFGRPGMRSRHNSAYWTGASYAGLGPSAHEFDGRRRRWNTAAYVDWLHRIDARQDPEADGEDLSSDNVIAERVYLGLRTANGLFLSEAEIARVQPWIDAGWAQLRAPGQIRLTALGWLRLDGLAADLTLVRSRY